MTVRRTLRPVCLAIAAVGLSASAALANSVPPADEIVVEGRLRGMDPAMRAFLSGDFATAEIEFERNFSFLKQRESRRRTELDFAFIAQQGGLRSARQGFRPSLDYLRGRDGLRRPGDVWSGTDIGTQLHMAGLSEIRQGKLEEARVSFDRALTFNKGLHDARYRLALIALGEGERDEARKHLSRLERALESCHSRCERLGDRPILENGIAELRRLLGKA